ncbi:outer membrane receptor protein involved in Fe transport [Duganella sp. SG902]|uniref:TonB-dependent receptor n=1 Tax=Duganella sp. SG902 TaxID=2587016 RepID=UPI00159E3922|nr:TonB-dependent receptor [Duganella sp. SG902]NVM80178.1 outer membrane receptor protein involved in Fe transport [Duganella sp. SG902]
MKRLAGVVMLAWGGALAAEAGPAAAALSVDVVGVAPLPGLGVDRDRLPYQVQTASAAAMGLGAGQNAAEFMARSLAGVNVNEISGSPFQNDLTFRGFRASPVLGTSQGISVYLDGVRVNEPFGDVVNWDMLPEAAISSVLLTPGSNPLFGLNTLGGALALTTKSGRGHAGLEAGVSVASNGQRRADLAYGYDSGRRWHAFVAATGFADRGWRDRSDGHLGNVYAKLDGVAGDNEWSIALLAGRSRLIGNGLLPDELYAVDRRAVYTSPDETRNRLRQLVLNVIHRFDERTELTAMAYARGSRRDTVNGDINDDFLEGESEHPATWNTTRTRQSSQGGNLHLSMDAGTHQLTAGVSFDRSSVHFAQYAQEAWFTPERTVITDADQEVDAGASVSGRSRAASMYAADTWALDAATWITLSARYNHARVSNQLPPSDVERFSYRRLNPSLGIAHRAADGWTVFANLSQSNRVPTVIELGCADPEQPCRLPVGLQSDPYLKQVVSRTVEAGVRNATVSVSLYRTVNDDDILFRSAGVAQHGYFANFDRTRHQGADLSASSQWGDWAARISYSYLDAVYDVEGDLFTGVRDVHVKPGTRIAGLPRNTLKLGVDWRPSPQLKLGADVSAVSGMAVQGNEDGQAGVGSNVAGHVLLGLRVSYQPSPKWEWYARVNNVANRRYASFGAVGVNMFSGDAPQPSRFVAPGAPRSVAAGVRLGF